MIMMMMMIIIIIIIIIVFVEHAKIFPTFKSHNLKSL